MSEYLVARNTLENSRDGTDRPESAQKVPHCLVCEELSIVCGHVQRVYNDTQRETVI